MKYIKSILVLILVLVSFSIPSFNRPEPRTKSITGTQFVYTRSMTDYGDSYTVSDGVGCDNDCVITPDGNIWRVGIETVSGGVYDVYFYDMNTETVEDDIVNMIVYHRPDGSLHYINL